MDGIWTGKYINYCNVRIIYACFYNNMIRCIKQKRHSVQRMNGQNLKYNKIPSVYNVSVNVIATCSSQFLFSYFYTDSCM